MVETIVLVELCSKSAKSRSFECDSYILARLCFIVFSSVFLPVFDKCMFLHKDGMILARFDGNAAARASLFDMGNGNATYLIMTMLHLEKRKIATVFCTNFNCMCL